MTKKDFIAYLIILSAGIAGVFIKGFCGGFITGFCASLAVLSIYGKRLATKAATLIDKKLNDSRGL